MQIKLNVVEGQLLNFADVLNGLFLLVKNSQFKIELLLDDSPCFEAIEIFETNFKKFLTNTCDILKIDTKRILIKSSNLVQDMSVWPNMVKANCTTSFTHGRNYIYNKEKDFTHLIGIFIGRCSWARLYLASYVDMLFPNDSLVTFWQHHFDSSQPANLSIDRILMKTQRDKNTLQMITNFCKKLPLHLYEHDREINKNTGGIDYHKSYHLLEHYHKIFIELICETMDYANTFYLTEKISRSLMTRTPFLVYGPPEYLKNLKRLGFKTFDDFWDEGYDKFDGWNRIVKIKNILRKLRHNEFGDYKKLYLKMYPILEHNQNTYKNLTGEQIDKVFNIF